MTISLKGRMPLRYFLFLMPVIGFCLAGFNDFYHNVVADYTSTTITTLWEELIGFIYPTGIIGFFFLVLLRHITNILFRTEFVGDKLSDIKKGSEADKAFFHGGVLMFLGGVLYLMLYVLFGSLFRGLLT